MGLCGFDVEEDKANTEYLYYFKKQHFNHLENVRWLGLHYSYMCIEGELIVA